MRFGAAQAIVRGAIVRDERETMVELEITPGRANRARLGRSPVSRPRDVLGTVRTVLFAPEDLALVKGDPSERRRFLDELLVQRQPRWSGVRSDYDKILKQRNALLKSAAPGAAQGAPPASRARHATATSRSTRRASRRCTPSTCGTTTWPRSARSCSMPVCACCGTSPPTCPSATTR